MLDSIMSWNWGTIFLGFISFILWCGLDTALKLLGDIKNRLGEIENKVVGIDSIRESVNRIEPRKDIANEVKAISKNINNIYKWTEDNEKMTNILDDIYGITYDIREHTKP
jgi:archaellum component FlaC